MSAQLHRDKLNTCYFVSLWVGATNWHLIRAPPGAFGRATSRQRSSKELLRRGHNHFTYFHQLEWQSLPEYSLLRCTWWRAISMDWPTPLGPRTWARHVCSTLLKNGWKQRSLDKMMFYLYEKFPGQTQMALAAVMIAYVDDFPLTHDDRFDRSKLTGLFTWGSQDELSLEHPLVISRESRLHWDMTSPRSSFHCVSIKRSSLSQSNQARLTRSVWRRPSTHLTCRNFVRGRVAYSGWLVRRDQTLLQWFLCAARAQNQRMQIFSRCIQQLIT